jgi:hypothetical protein
VAEENCDSCSLRVAGDVVNERDILWARNEDDANANVAKVRRMVALFTVVQSTSRAGSAYGNRSLLST